MSWTRFCSILMGSFCGFPGFRVSDPAPDPELITFLRKADLERLDRVLGSRENDA